MNFTNPLRKTIYPEIYPKITKIIYKTAQNVRMREDIFLIALNVNEIFAFKP